MEKKTLKANLNNKLLEQFDKEFPKTVEELNVLLKILKSFGIISAYQHLNNPEIVPEVCLNKASRSLDLLAYHGDKWLFEPWLTQQLERLRLRQGKVRFLISDSINSKSVARCSELMNAFPNVFKVRIFRESAIFRVIIIDDAHLLLGHYGYEVIEKDGNNAQGWKSPQLFIEDNRQWSLLIPFREMFRIAWENASEIHAVNPEILNLKSNKAINIKKGT